MPHRTRSGRQSQAWKGLERQVAEALKGKRVHRGDDFSVSDVDVEVPDLSHLRIDAKYRKRHAHHTFMAAIEETYCTEDGDEPVLATKHHRQEGAYVTIRLSFFAELLDAVRKLNAKR